MGMEYRGIVGFPSHSMALCAAMVATRGPVLEVGGGVYSTPLLHGLCRQMGREHLVIESDPDWLDRLREFYPQVQVESPNHMEFHMPHDLWGLVFVDGHESQRGIVISTFADKCEMIVVHDTEANHAHNYPGMHEALDSMRYRLDFEVKPFKNQTTIASNHINLKEVIKL